MQILTTKLLAQAKKKIASLEKELAAVRRGFDETTLRRIIAEEIHNNKETMIKTLQIVVPTKGKCGNDCGYCVSKTHDDSHYQNLIEQINKKSVYEEDYMRRLSFARDLEANTLVFTAVAGEATSNLEFMGKVYDLNKRLPSPFSRSELQTSGIYLNHSSLDFLRDIKIDIINLSLASIWDSAQNATYHRPRNKNCFVEIEQLCAEIKQRNFMLRLSLNLTDFYNNSSPEEIFSRAKALGADQITFKVLYNTPNPHTTGEKEVHDFIDQHRANPEIIAKINEYIRLHGQIIDRLNYGPYMYAIGNISTVLDDNCMNLEPRMRYLILRPDIGLYPRWDTDLRIY